MSNRQAETQTQGILRRLRKNKLAMVGGSIILLFTLMAVFAPLLAPHSPTLTSLSNRLKGPTAEHPLGTDGIGRDVLSRIIYGSRYSLMSGLISVGIAVLVGTLLGLAAGYYGGWLESLIMRFMDMLLAFPGILLAVAFVAVLGRGYLNAMIAVGLHSVPGFARVVRGSVLSLKEREFVEAARAAGAKDSRIILKHILPNVLTPVIVMATMRLGTTILAAAGLSFIGLGAQPPLPEWGAMLSEGRSYLRSAPHITTFPGIAILLTVVGFNLLGDGVRDALDPKLKY